MFKLVPSRASDLSSYFH